MKEIKYDVLNQVINQLRHNYVVLSKSADSIEALKNCCIGITEEEIDAVLSSINSLMDKLDDVIGGLDK